MDTSDGNPIRGYQARGDLSYEALAASLGISIEYAKKLAVGAIGWVSVGRALEFDERTGGALRFDDVIAWGARNGHAPSAGVLARLHQTKTASAAGSTSEAVS